MLLIGSFRSEDIQLKKRSFLLFAFVSSFHITSRQSSTMNESIISLVSFAFSSFCARDFFTANETEYVIVALTTRSQSRRYPRARVSLQYSALPSSLFLSMSLLHKDTTFTSKFDCG